MNQDQPQKIVNEIMADLGQKKERPMAMSHKQGSERTATFGKIGKLGGGIGVPIRM